MRSPRSSRRRSTQSSGTPPTTRTAIPFRTPTFGSSSAAIGRLLDLEPGDAASVSRVPDGDPELLRYLAELGLVPGSHVEIVQHAPFAGPVTVRTTSGDHAISRELADRIGVASG